MSLAFAHIEYSISTKSLDIFNIGCDGSCKGCCNPEIKSWDINGLNSLQVLKRTEELVDNYGNLITRIFLVGGDPVDCYKHYPEYLGFVKALKTFGKPIYLFTRHAISEIPKELGIVDFIKTGAYMPELKCDNNIQEGIKLATANQELWKVTGELCNMML